MAQKTLIATAIAAMLAAGPAMAQESLCQSRMDAVTGDHGDVFEGRGHGSAQVVLRQLRNAAVRLRAQDLDRACLQTVEAMEATIEAYRAAGGLEGDDVAVSPELGDIEQRSVAFGATGMETSTIEDADVYNYNAQYLGEVSGLLMEGGRATHAVLGPGSLWDVGASQAAIPIDMMRWDPEWEAFFVPIPEGALQEAPAYTADASAWSREENDRYYRSLGD